MRDTFVHGLSDFGNIHKPAQDVIIKTSEYLRHSIIKLLDLSEAVLKKLLSNDYDVARGPLMIQRILRGELVGTVDQLAAEDQVYPIFTWNSKLKTVAIGGNGIYGFQTEEYLTIKIGAAAQFRPQRHEVWDGSVLKRKEGPVPSEVINAAVVPFQSKLRRRVAAYIRKCLLSFAAKLQPP